MMLRPKTTVLSCFFDENTRLVSGMCSRCYRESTEVRIVAVNRRFLYQVEQRKKESRDFEDIVTCGHQSELESENENDACVVCLQPSNKLVEFEKTNKQSTSLRQNNNKKEIFVTSDDDVDDDDASEMKHSENKTAMYSDLTSLKGNQMENLKEEAAMKNEIKDDIRQSSTNIFLKKETSSDQSTKENEMKAMKSDCCESSELRYSKYFDRNLHKTSELKGGECKIKVETKEEAFLNFVPVWHPPKSPHNLIEESLYTDPWALLVATIFLNKTSCATARPYIEWFLSDFHNPFEVLKYNPADLEKYFVAIGLKKRARQVWRMSHDFVHKEWKDVKELHGIGSYGRDAFNMFCLGRMHIEPKDRFLRIYKAWFDILEKDKKGACLVEERNEDESEDSGFGCSSQD